MTKIDKIYLNQLSFYGYHGLFKAETELGQRFLVDLVLYTSLEAAGQSDQMEDSIDYGAVYDKVKTVVEGQPKKLVEAVAAKIAEELLGTFEKLNALTVKVIKPDPPIPGHYESVAVEIYREKRERL